MCSFIRFRATICLAFAVLLAARIGLCAAGVTFSNASIITVNDGVAPPTLAPPYPSSITVAGFSGQVVTKATVTLFGFTHGFPSDVDILLVGPQGQKSIVMANAGGQNKYSVTNVALTFDDDASSTLPIYARLVSGTFKPTDGYAMSAYPNLPFDFPAPAPAGNSNSPTALSVFKNTDPSGVWKLFVVDDVSGDEGTIGGWSLTLSIAIPLQIQHIETNTVVSWPASATNCSLQSSIGLSTSWNNVTNVPIAIGSRNYVTNRVAGGSTFYRLVQHGVP
jgi:subtilisin-like proprotein convertase family protein